MLLAIDVGNTQITGGLFDGEKLVFQFRRTTNMGTSSDEIGIFFRTVIRENGFDCNKIAQIGCCSVVPSINYSLSSAMKKYFKICKSKRNWGRQNCRFNRGCKPSS